MEDELILALSTSLDEMVSRTASFLTGFLNAVGEALAVTIRLIVELVEEIMPPAPLEPYVESRVRRQWMIDQALWAQHARLVLRRSFPGLHGPRWHRARDTI